MPLQLHLRTEEAKRKAKEAAFRAVQETFELDIKPRAVELSPVSETWPSIPASRGEKRIDHGTNRRSIDTEVEQTPEGIKATLFTQSGYGGYLEVGTRKMPARPYLWPAFQQFVGRVAERARSMIRG